MDSFSMTIRQKWLGQPASAQGVVPATAGRLVRPEGGTYLNRAELQPNTATADVAVVALLKDAMWRAGQWVNGTTTFTDDTQDAQDADTNDFALETTTAADGFIVGANDKFGAISLDVTTAGVGATAHVIEYWDGAAWTAIAAAGMLVDIPGRAGVIAAGEQLVMFISPVNWEKGGSGTGTPQNTYNVRIRATTGTITTAALARRIYVGRILMSVANLAINGSYERAFPNPIYLSGAVYAAIGAAFDAANEGNAFFAEVSDGTPF